MTNKSQLPQDTLDRLAMLDASKEEIDAALAKVVAVSGKPAPDAVLLATQQQHVGRPKGEPAKFMRNGKLETCRCFDCRALSAPVPQTDGPGEFKTCPGCEMRRTCQASKHCAGPSHAELKERFVLPSPAVATPENAVYQKITGPGVDALENRKEQLASPPIRRDLEAIARLIYDAGSPSDPKDAWKEARRVADAILSLPVQPGAGERVLMPLDLSDKQADAALRATAVWLEVKGSQLTVNREKMKARYRSLVTFILSCRPSDEITPDQFAWLNERAAEMRKEWADHASRQTSHSSSEDKP